MSHRQECSKCMMLYLADGQAFATCERDERSQPPGWFVRSSEHNAPVGGSPLGSASRSGLRALRGGYVSSFHRPEG